MGLLSKLNSKEQSEEQPIDPPPPYQDQAGSVQTDVKATTTENLTATRTSSSRTQRLPKTIAIPATTKKLGSAYLRAYPPCLQSYSIDKDEFMDFLDTLNRVTVKSPPLEVIGLAGVALSFVPVHNINLIGMGVDWGTKLVGAAISKGRTELLLRRVNREMFAPRGLKVEIAQLDGLAKIAGIPVLDAEGKVVKKATLLEPLGEASNGDDDQAARLDVQQRRLKTLEEYIAPLDVEGLPEIERPKNPLSKWSVASSEWNRKRGEKSMMKKRDKNDAKRERKIEKAERKREKRLSKIASDTSTNSQSTLEERAHPQTNLEKRVSVEGNSKADRRLEKAERKYNKRVGKATEKSMHNKREEKSFRKVLWVIIRDLDADSGKGENPDVGSDFSVEDSSGSDSEDSSSLEEEMEDLKVSQ